MSKPAMEERQKRYINKVQPGQTGFFTSTGLDFARAFERPEMKEEMVRSLLRESRRHYLFAQVAPFAFKSRPCLVSGGT